MSNGNGHHWSKFSWRDWHSDVALHPCSLAARGFWLELLCMMHEGSPVGHLANNGKQVTIRQMAANAGCSDKEATKLLGELEEADVFSRTEDGTIYNRRMVKDAAQSEEGRQHVAKRWGTNSPHPPNRGPNRRPNGSANSYPTREPITQNLDTESELESREEKDSKSLILTSKVEYEAPPTREGPPTAAEIAAERRRHHEALASVPAPVAAVLNSLAESMSGVAYAPGWSPKRTAEEQAAAVEPKRPKTYHLTPEQLRVARAAAAAAASRRAVA